MYDIITGVLLVLSVLLFDVFGAWLDQKTLHNMALADMATPQIEGVTQAPSKTYAVASEPSGTSRAYFIGETSGDEFKVCYYEHQKNQYVYTVDLTKPCPLYIKVLTK